MGNCRIDNAIIAFSQDGSDANLEVLLKEFMRESLHVPVSEEVTETTPGCHNASVICIRTELGLGAIPAFTTMEHLINWKPRGCLYITLTGRVLVTMAMDMKKVDEIAVNVFDTPRGRISRSDFRNMLDFL